MALVAHVKCRFTFAMADEFVAKIRATAQLFIRWKRACNGLADTPSMRIVFESFDQPNSEYQVDTQSFSLSHLVLLIQ